ncbi:hypothetical protein [Nitrobacter winogradskyi]|uniref:hypothetical protein n=1 Tax=Nitrobacter winogradskyi TaxID=913 RepID=UPI0015E82E57|nr:hypothetical protein [Nitrobacter winogradskyi]
MARAQIQRGLHNRRTSVVMIGCLHDSAEPPSFPALPIPTLRKKWSLTRDITGVIAHSDRL